LQNLFAGADRILQRGTFLNGVSDGLFEIDVFAGGQGVDGHAHMPVVGRCDDDGVEPLLEDLAIVRMSGGDAVGAGFDGVATRGVDVADGDDLILADLVGGFEQVVDAAAGADDADAQGVVGPDNAG